MTGRGPRAHSGTAAGALAAVCVAAASFALSTSAWATFPGANGQIAVTHHPGTSDVTTDRIYTFDPVTGTRTQLTHTTARDDEPSYSADGERIVFTRRQGVGPSRVWIMNADGTGQAQVAEPPDPETTNDRSPSFSPDGAKIVFVRDRIDEQPQLWTMNTDGSAQTQLTFEGANEAAYRFPAFSPDGRRIVAQYQEDSSRYRIAVLGADGSNTQLLTSGSESDYVPDWSPDGSRITFERNAEVWTMNSDGSGQRQITDVGETDFAMSPVYAPDASRILWVFNDDGGDFSDLMLADPNGFNQVTPLTDNEAGGLDDYEPSWQPLNPPACDLSGRATQKAVGSIRLTVTCANENATVVAAGKGKAAKVGRAAASKKGKKKFKIPAVTAQVPPGTPTTVKLAIAKKGAKALRRALGAGRKGKASVTATLTDDLGQASTEVYKVTFKKKRT